MFLLVFIPLRSETVNTELYQYLHPVPESELVSTSNNVLIRFGENIDRNTFSADLLEVKGDKSDLIPGYVQLLPDNMTIMYRPDEKYQTLETLTVTLATGIKTAEGEDLPELTFTFTTASTDPIKPDPQEFLKKGEDPDAVQKRIEKSGKYEKALAADLPADFPTIQTANPENGAPGYHAVSTFADDPQNTDGRFRIFFDNYGTPVYYERTDNPNSAFRVQPHELISFYNFEEMKYDIFSRDMRQTINGYARNGYFADFKDFKMGDTWNQFVLCRDREAVDMTPYDQNAETDAQVDGFILQEIDQYGNCVFQWRSWDNFDIADAADYVDLSEEYVDLVGATSVCIESDTTLLISCASLNEITKIDRRTGEIIWRLGGANNDFEFVGVDAEFSLPGYVQRAEDGNLVVFDKGAYRDGEKITTVSEYVLDEDNMTATLFRRAGTDPATYTTNFGNAYKLPNGNYYAAFGESNGPDIVEFDGETGASAYEAVLDGFSTYNSYKVGWITNLFDFEGDFKEFLETLPGESRTMTFNIRNYTDEPITITSYSSRTGEFEPATSPPYEIGPKGKFPVSIEFTPAEIGEYHDVLTFNVDTEDGDRRIARQLFIEGVCTEDAPRNIDAYQYISPVPSSKLNSKFVDLIIRFGPEINENTVDGNLISVVGENSGERTGEFFLYEDGKSLMFDFDEPFELGERVFVELNEGITTTEGDLLPHLKYSFEISPTGPNWRHEPTSVEKRDPIFDILPFEKFPEKPVKFDKPLEDNPNQLPDDFPTIEVTRNVNPSPGYNFSGFFSFGSGATVGSYLIVHDNFGVPVYYRGIPFTAIDIDVFDNGDIAYFNNQTSRVEVLNHKGELIDSVYMGYGYIPDIHEVSFNDDGSYWMMCYDDQKFPIRDFETGDFNELILTGLLVQKLDENDVVVFQWRSWDSFDIYDNPHYIYYHRQRWDFIHGNSIAEWGDESIVISSRHLDEITNISYVDGKVKWRLGGAHSIANDFEYLNDDRRFSHQHCARQLEDGNLLLFDNGNGLDPLYSSAIIYDLDEQNMTAELLERYAYDEETVFGAFMGSSIELDNGNIYVGWGGSFDQAITEFDRETGDVLFSVYVPDAISYRANKHGWETGIFDLSADTLDFEKLDIEENPTKIMTVTLANNYDREVEISHVYSMYDKFVVNETFPFTIPVGGTKEVEIEFTPIDEGDFWDVLTFNYPKNDSERVAQQLFVKGEGEKIGSVKAADLSKDFKLYPNPTSGPAFFENVSESTAEVLIITDIYGRDILRTDARSGAFALDLGFLSSGVYLAIVNYSDGTSKRMKFVKQ